MPVLRWHAASTVRSAGAHGVPATGPAHSRDLSVVSRLGGGRPVLRAQRGRDASRGPANAEAREAAVPCRAARRNRGVPRSEPKAVADAGLGTCEWP